MQWTIFEGKSTSQRGEVVQELMGYSKTTCMEIKDKKHQLPIITVAPQMGSDWHILAPYGCARSQHRPGWAGGRVDGYNLDSVLVANWLIWDILNRPLRYTAAVTFLPCAEPDRHSMHMLEQVKETYAPKNIILLNKIGRGSSLAYYSPETATGSLLEKYLMQKEADGCKMPVRLDRPPYDGWQDDKVIHISAGDGLFLDPQGRKWAEASQAGSLDPIVNPDRQVYGFLLRLITGRETERTGSWTDQD